MNLVDTLFSIEKYLGLKIDSLQPLADEDNIGGYHPDESQRQWPPGGVWDVEGRALYALIRALQPDNVLEIGIGQGCSASHIASALKANGHGHLTSIDRGNSGGLIPDDLRQFVTIIPGDALDYLEAQPDNSIDFLLEDADHSEALCYAVAELAKRKLRPGGVLLGHDAAHFLVGRDVLAGYDRAGLDYRVYLTEPSDCGWLVWKRAEAPTSAELAASLADTEPVLQAQEEQTPVPKKKRTRKAARR